MSKKTSSKRRQKRAAGLEKHKEQERQKKKGKRRREVQDLLSFLKRKSDKYPEELEVDARARNTIIVCVY